MTTILHEQTSFECADARASGEALWMSAGELERATGWASKPEGLCKGDVCVPLPRGRETDIARDGRVDAAAAWRHMGHPVAHDISGATWVLGTNAGDRSAALNSLTAPDFALPDLAGNVTSLAGLRGKKVLLATWASW